MTDRDHTGGRPYLTTRHAGVCRRGSRYVVRVVIDGRKVQRSAATIEEAKQLRAELVAERRRGDRRSTDGRVTLEEYSSRWLASYQGRTGHGVRGQTVDGYARDLELHVLPALGDTPLADITPQDVKLLVSQLVDGSAPSRAGHQRRKLSAGSVRNAVAPLRALLATAVEELLIPANPCAVIRVASPRLGDRAVRVLDRDEVARLLDAAPEGLGRCLLRVLAEGGLRISEALGLRWADLDLAAEPPRLRVERRIVDGDVDVPKSSFGRRTVPLTRQAARELRAWRLASPWSLDTDSVFCDELGGPWRLWDLRRRILDPAARVAGLDTFGFHVLRHSFVTNLLRAGVPAVTVSRLAGHASPAFTLSVYSHVLAADLPDLDALAGWGG